MKPKVDAIIDSIQGCMKESAVDALDVIGVQGGYYKEPDKYLDLGYAFIPYYYYEGEFLMPEITLIEKELASYIDDSLSYCIDRIDNQGFSLDYNKRVTKATILEKEVKFDIDLALSIKYLRKSTIYQFNDISIFHNSKLFDILEVAKYITNSHKQTPDMVCISCVSEIAKEKGVSVDMLSFGDEKTTLIVISENITAVEGYNFEFLNKYPNKKISIG
jgi:hypothetical protein